MPMTRFSWMSAAIAAAALAACSRAHSRDARTPAFVELPLDSIMKTLGPDVAKNGATVACGGNDSFAAPRFDRVCSLEFTAPQRDSEVVADIVMRLRDLAPRRGVRVTGWTRDAGGVESLSYEMPSANGWIVVVSLKPRRTNLDLFLVTGHEVDRSSRISLFRDD
jgi:hypothetical protein